MAGTLILCATPIGNLGDVSTRLTETLERADVVFAEDTRRTGHLLAHLGVSKPMRSYFAGNERSRNDELATLLSEGNTVALVSDAGMPVVSDPGMSAVAVAVAVGAAVSAIPGPSAPVMAVAVSGFSGDRFVFEGFLPRKGADRAQRLAAIASETRTVVFFAATRRVGADLTDLAAVAEANRRIVVTRELTKLHEEVWRGTVAEAADHWSVQALKGEFTVVVEGASIAPGDIGEALRYARELIAEGTSPSRAVKAAASANGISKSELYDLVVRDVDEETR